MLTPQERYTRDPHFKTLVDILTHHIAQCDYTPTEIREAAMLAVIRYETIHARPEYRMHGDHLQRVDAYHKRLLAEYDERRKREKGFFETLRERAPEGAPEKPPPINSEFVSTPTRFIDPDDVLKH